MKIAFTTEDLLHVNAHFGSASRIAFYEVGPESSCFLGIVEFGGDLSEDGNEDKLFAKVQAIAGCTLLYTAAIGASGSARVRAVHVHPVKVAESERIDALAEQLRETLRGTPPMWLRNVLNINRARDTQFEAIHG